MSTACDTQRFLVRDRNGALRGDRETLALAMRLCRSSKGDTIWLIESTWHHVDGMMRTGLADKTAKSAQGAARAQKSSYMPFKALGKARETRVY